MPEISLARSSTVCRRTVPPAVHMSSDAYVTSHNQRSVQKQSC